MAHAATASKVFVVAALALVLLVPCVASAGWGDGNWGEMVWGAAAMPVPSLSIKSLIVLVLVLAIAPSAWLASRRRVSKQ